MLLQSHFNHYFISFMRQSNFELLRVICISLIILMHCYGRVPVNDMNTVNYSLGFAINAVGNVGVSIFVLISGYFGVKFKGDRFFQLIYLTIAYTTLTTFLNKGFVSSELFKTAIGVFRQSSSIWFIVCYLLLLLFSPFINPALEILTRRQYHRLLFIGFIVLNIMTTFLTPVDNYVTTATGKSFLYFIFLYIIGRYLRLHADVHPTHRTSLFLGFVASSLVILVGNVVLSFLFHKTTNRLSIDCSPFILSSALCLFHWTKTWQLRSTFINGLASSVLAIYLLDGLGYFFDRHLFHLSTFRESTIFPVILLSEVLCVLLMAVCLDKMRAALLTSWETRVFTKINAWGSRLLDKLPS